MPVFAAAVIAMVCLIAVLAPVLSPHNPIRGSLRDSLRPPAWQEEGTSTMGNRIGYPLNSRCLAIRGWPFSIRHTSVLVPPTSKVTMSGTPALMARWAAPMTPAAGPEANVLTALAPASRGEATPPFDCRILGAISPISLAWASIRFR